MGAANLPTSLKTSRATVPNNSLARNMPTSTRMPAIADKVGALYLVDMAHFAGLVAGGVHPSPVPHAQIVTTTTHKTLRGPRGGMILARQEHGTAIDKVVFPGMQGGPLVHII